MKKVEYFCNLCGEKDPLSNLFSLFWDSVKTPQRYVLVKNLKNESDKHICINCVKLIKESE